VDNAFDGHDLSFCISADGVEFSAWEHKHPQYNIDSESNSRKHGRCGYKYMFYLALWCEKCVMVDGPHKSGKSELQIFRDGMKKKLPAGKRVVVDRGVKCDANAEELGIFSYPNEADSKELAKFKSRARQRQESFHGRLRKFAIMNDIFRHGMDKHGLAVNAVSVIVQMEINNGSVLFDP